MQEYNIDILYILKKTSLTAEVMLLLKKLNLFCFYKKDLTCLMTKSHYEKKEPFTSKFTGNFIVTVNLTFL